MKKLASVVLASAMAVVPFAAGLAATFTPGEYEASAQGFGGAVTVKVTVDEEKVTAVTVTGEGETPTLGGAAIEGYNTSLVGVSDADAVDATAGATVTSTAVKDALAKALAEAKGEAVANDAAVAFTAGTYTGTAKGYNGPVEVSVTFSDSAVTAIEVGANKETDHVGNVAFEPVIADILAANGTGVDGVSGATFSSNAIRNAVNDAAEQAGCTNMDAFKAATVKHEAQAAIEETYDVVVVGAGAAGLSAANTALEAGANVLILEKTGVTGGSTARSGGKILGAGTEWQTAQGFTDTPDMMYDYLMSFDRDGIMDADLVRTFCDNSAENIQWLVDRGVQMQDVEPIHSSLTPWRVHNVKGGGGQTSGHGGQFTAPLTNLYEGNGGKILYNCTANELLTDESGAVVGVKGTMADGSTVTVNAKGVILATGGYAHNEEMLSRYNDFLPTNIYSGVPMTNVGDGLVMAEAVGAKNFDAPGLQLVYVSYDCYVGINEESGLIVTNKGERVVNEWSYQSHVAQALADAKSPCGYYITAVKNGACVEPYPMLAWGVTMENVPHAATIAELAEQIGMDASALEATVTRYNELCEKGKDEDFGKPAEYMIPVEGETYYAFYMTPGSSVTFGGLQIDTDAHVLDTNDQPISGLYAAGEVAFTGLFDAEYPCCGMAIGSAVYYGRVAAANAVAGK